MPFEKPKPAEQSKPSESPKKSNIEFELSEPKFKIEDLILPEQTKNELKRAIGLNLHQASIFNDWGFSETHKYDNKMIINLYGESGTGKTMAAHAIAEQMKRKIILINYGDIESKYVGETPKNIQSAFEFAKSNQAILFFDEADAILSRRVTNMTQATDTSVNQTRSVMLNLLNDYNDTVLFATNFISNYDPAFMRRILIHIEFKLPDEETRKQLLQKYIPNRLPHNINLDLAAKESETLSGSDIANCILLAGFSAKTENMEQVTHELLIEKISAVKKSKLANANKSSDWELVSQKEVSPEYAQQQLNKGK